MKRVIHWVSVLHECTVSKFYYDETSVNLSRCHLGRNILLATIIITWLHVYFCIVKTQGANQIRLYPTMKVSTDKPAETKNHRIPK